MTKAEIIAKYAIHEGDTGSPEVQIALLTERINHLNEHLNTSRRTRTTTIPAVACSRWSAAAAAFRTTLKRPTSSATARYAPSLACASN